MFNMLLEGLQIAAMVFVAIVLSSCIHTRLFKEDREKLLKNPGSLAKFFYAFYFIALTVLALTIHLDPNSEVHGYWYAMSTLEQVGFSLGLCFIFPLVYVADKFVYKLFALRML